MKKILFLLLLVGFTLVGCSNPTTPNNPDDKPIYEPYVPTNTILSFSDENANKVITEPTFDISKYTADPGKNKIKPHDIFASGMCLQRDAINRIWGKASSTKNIAIELKGEVYYGSVNGQDWEVYLPKMNAGGPYNLTIISELGRITLTDVYFGEVFYLGGQSNMEMSVAGCGDALKYLYTTQDCVNDKIRMLTVPWNLQDDPAVGALRNCKWKSADKNNILTFSAVGYLFGRQMQEELDCPVGLIWSAVGGSNIESWLSDENYSKIEEIYTPYKSGEPFMEPTVCYNGMLYPLTGINVRGVLWYQGESNAFGTEQYYDQALKIFIDQCRKMFNNQELAFTICELARYEGLPFAYSVVNEKINTVAENDPYIVVARNLDQGDWFNIHPVNKKELGLRAAYETLRVFFKFDKEEPVKITSYTFNDDGSVTINLSKEIVKVNGTNGFEVYVNNSYTTQCNVTVTGSQLTITSSGEIEKVRYGYQCEITDDIKSDVSKMVSIYDENGFPLDLFLITK